MNESISVFSWKGIVFSLAGLLSLCMIYFLFSGKKVAFLPGVTATFFILFALGLTMSIFSGSRFLRANGFLPVILSILKTLGYLSFILVILTPILTWVGVKSTFYGYQQAGYIMAAIILLKWILVRGTDLIYMFTK